jgi:cobalt/nickel transport system permease protein
MAARCFRPGTGMHTYRTYAYLVGMLLVRSHGRSRSIYNAMLCRGFRGHFPVVNHFHLHRADIVFGLVMAALTAALILTGIGEVFP